MRHQTHFCIVGQPKSGTTAMAEMLNQHPEIEISTPKEPAFFCTDFQQESDRFYGKESKRAFQIRTFNDYQKTFSSNKKIKGDASTNYLYSNTAPRNIYNHNSDCKIIVMFREPVSFLTSLHSQYIADTSEHEKNLWKAIELESSRKNGLHLSNRIKTPSYLFYNERIKYKFQLERYIATFSPQKVKVLIYDHFKDDNLTTYQEVIKFLDCNKNFLPTTKTTNVAHVPKNIFLNKLVRNPFLSSIPKKILNSRYYDKLQITIQNLISKPKKSSSLTKNVELALKKRYFSEVVALNKLIRENKLTQEPVDLLDLWGYNNL